MTRRRPWIGILLTACFTALLAAGYVYVLRRYPIDRLPIEWRGQKIELLAPRWLGLAIPMPYLIFVATRTLTDLSWLQRTLSLLFRTALILSLALALARPSQVAVEQRVATVFCVDVSDSISDKQLNKAYAYVEQAWRKTRPARPGVEPTEVIRVVTFARRPRPLEIPEGAKRLPEFKRHGRRDETGPRPGTGGSAGGSAAATATAKAAATATAPAASSEGAATDIQAALQLGYGLFPAGYLRRFVVITDGHETQGDFAAEAHRAGEAKIPVFTVSFPEEQTKEVLIQSLNLPDKVKVGAPFEVKTEIFSTHEEEEVTLRLYQDEFANGLEPVKKVSLQPGKNTFTFRSQVKQPGFVSYRLEMSGAKQDTQKANNRASAALAVRGKPRVLYVEGEGAGAQLSLTKALIAENIDVEARGPHGLPASLKEMEKYDLIILSDVPATYVSLGQMALLEQYVRDLGGGFIMAGGENSFGSGGYGKTRIEKLLPVRFDTEKKRDQAVVAISLVIDKSGSMAGEKMELAKEAAKAAAEMMSSNDLINVIAFDSVPITVVKLQRAANRARIVNDISRIVASGNTNILAPLEEAFRELGPANAKVKHVILLTDGEAPYAGIPELVDQMAAAKITVSAVGVGHGADRRLLQMIAERGNGRFYFTADASNVPKIFTKETAQVARSALVEEAVIPHVVKQVDLLRGIDMGSAPPLKGYVATKPKPLSEVIMVSDYGEPILARWRQGLGKAVAWTSDVKPRWAQEWVRWPGYAKFFAQLARDTMRHHVQESFDLRTEVVGDRARVIIDAVGKDDKFINGLDTRLQVIDPERPNLTRYVKLYQTAAGRYEGDFPLDKYGAFMLKAEHRLAEPGEPKDGKAASGRVASGGEVSGGEASGREASPGGNGFGGRAAKREREVQGSDKAPRGKIVAESLGTVSIPYPREYLSQGINKALLGRVVSLTRGSMNPTLEAVFDPRGEEVRYHKDLWSRAVQLALGLFLLDVLLRRVRLFGRRSYRA